MNGRIDKLTVGRINTRANGRQGTGRRTEERTGDKERAGVHKNGRATRKGRANRRTDEPTECKCTMIRYQTKKLSRYLVP